MNPKIIRRALLPVAAFGAMAFKLALLVALNPQVVAAQPLRRVMLRALPAIVLVAPNPPVAAAQPPLNWYYS